MIPWCCTQKTSTWAHLNLSSLLQSGLLSVVYAAKYLRMWRNVKVKLAIIMKMENEGYHTAQKTVENDICPLCDRVILSFHIKTYKFVHMRGLWSVALRKILWKNTRGWLIWHKKVLNVWRSGLRAQECADGCIWSFMESLTKIYVKLVGSSNTKRL